MTDSTPEPYEGQISVTKRGFGFFSFGDDHEDLIILPENLGTAIHGDTVKVIPAGTAPAKGQGEAPRAAGKVIEIVARNRTEFVGTLAPSERNPANTLMLPDWKRMHVPFRIADTKGIPHGEKVLVKMTGWNADSELPDAEIIEDIGKSGVHDVEMRSLALAQGFSPDYPPGVVNEANALEKNGEALLAKGVAGRRDFRQVPTCTIDPADAKDFDDALSVQTLPDGNIEVGVHIADVSYFVRPGSAIDEEAKKRATSVYLVDRTIPMLPHVLSNNLCSLNQDVDRLAVSAVFTLDKNAKILDTWFGSTAIHSDRRFTYEDAQKVLDTGEGQLKDELFLLKDLADKIRAARIAHGAVDFDTAEIKVILDAAGKPIEIKNKERLQTMMLIEDFMLLANVAVAEHLSELSQKHGGTFDPLFRVHAGPDSDRIENLVQFLRVMGYNLETHGGTVKGPALNKLLAETKGTPEEYLIKTATLRSMSKAIYTTRNVGHFGLAFEHYTHFTSPIRRYPDLLTHRLIKHWEKSQLISPEEVADFNRMAAHSSEREASATEAERDSIKMKIAEFMVDKVGQEFDAVISGVADRGLFVELKETHAEGMVPVRTIGDDYYTLDEKHYRLVGERTKKSYQLGDPIRVKLISSRPLEKEMDFALV